jgi:hypothetical protein
MDQVYAMLAGQTQPEHVEMGTAPGRQDRPGLCRISPLVTWLACWNMCTGSLVSRRYL